VGGTQDRPATKTIYIIGGRRWTEFSGLAGKLPEGDGRGALYQESGGPKVCASGADDRRTAGFSGKQESFNPLIEQLIQEKAAPRKSDQNDHSVEP